VILGEHRDLGPHADLQQELLRRMIQSAADDTRPGIPAEEVFAKLEKQFAAPQPEPAVWKPS